MQIVRDIVSVDCVVTTLKVTEIASEVIFAKPEVTCFEPEVTFL